MKVLSKIIKKTPKTMALRVFNGVNEYELSQKWVPVIFRGHKSLFDQSRGYPAH